MLHSYQLGYLRTDQPYSFGQEQVPIPAISAVTSGGAPGQAATIAGAAVSDLLAGANACAKLQRGDQILAELGTGADAIKAAIGMVAAEKNFNPFAQSIPTICDDPTLPASQQLRGITPLIDPAVGGSDVANALSKKTETAPLDATGMSVADLLKANGFSNFTGQAAAAASGAASSAAPAATASASAAPVAVSAGNATSAIPAGCPGAADAAPAAAASSSAVSVAASSATAAAAQTGAAAPGSVAGADFGLCTPTMKFEGGLGGRPATEFTFQAIDPLVAKGQEEALNPNIITNRICDQLTNVCNANAEAKSVCQDAKTAIAALGTRDKSTADQWNSMLGFAGAVTNPDGGAAQPAASATAAAGNKRTIRKGRAPRKFMA